MKTRWFTLISILVILSFAVAPSARAQVAADTQALPANRDKIEAALVSRGVIPANSTPEERDAAVTAYLQLKFGSGSADKYANPLARKQLDANEEYLNLTASDTRGKKLGNTKTVDPSTPQFKELEGSDKLLLILVEFGDAENYTGKVGPLHNEIPTPTNDFDLWVPDFSTTHYQEMMFTPGGWTIPDGVPIYAGERRGSMYDYYLEQSYGKYTVEGDTYGWFKVDYPEAYYGDDNPAGGNDNLLPGTPKDVISDVVVKINAASAIPWEEYDSNGDCIIDHPLFVHAGVDQSGGGGAQGDDAIWAHSSSTWVNVGTTATCPDGMYIYNYTIMPEDGGVGVFAHEFGHDLGLPDEYDTIYSGSGDSVGFWSLMSSGSWVGRPAQTQPSDMSIWARYALGWLIPGEDVAVTSLASLSAGTQTIRLEQAERWGGEGTLNAVRINLPPKAYFVNAPHSGVYEWFGGKADQIDTTLVRTVDLTGKTSAELSFWTWYDIEENWDFGFVQVSEDGGATWTSLAIDGTSSVIDPGGMPEIAANLPGFTGNSGGWVYKTADLSAYAGKSIKLQFRYMTDWATSLSGFYVDDIGVTADGAPVFFDNVETLDVAWTATGWTRETGSGTKTHYYMMEWRNFNPMETAYGDTSIVNFDNGLTNVYQYDTYGSTGNPDQPWYFSYNPGLVLWYRDMTYTDNWTGVHPGGGFLLVVDAHKQTLYRPSMAGLGSIAWSSRVQTYDAAFSLHSVPNLLLGYWGKVRRYMGLNPVPNFDDSLTYWSSRAPTSGVITPDYGLIFRVAGEAEDGSAAVVGIGLK